MQFVDSEISRQPSGSGRLREIVDEVFNKKKFQFRADFRPAVDRRFENSIRKAKHRRSNSGTQGNISACRPVSDCVIAFSHVSDGLPL